MTSTYILLFHLSTWSVNGGMALMTAEFSSRERCEEAGQMAERKFGGVYSRPFWLCVQK